jgi:hypothetical protein
LAGALATNGSNATNVVVPIRCNIDMFLRTRSAYTIHWLC